MSLNPAGLGMIRDKASGEMYGFTYGQIRNFRGQSERDLRKMGLKMHRDVEFEATEDWGRLETVTLKG